MDSKELAHYSIQLEKLHKDGDYEDVLSLLADLNSSTVSLEQLQTTDIAKTVYQLLKTCPVAAVRKTVKGLLSGWKRQYGSQRGKCQIKGPHECNAEINMSGPSTQQQEDRNEKEFEAVLSHTAEDSNGNHKSGLVSAQLSSKGAAFSVETGKLGPDSGTVSVGPPQPSSSPGSTALRDKCVKLLLQALTPELKTGPGDASHFTTIAQAIEENIYALYGQNQPKYKSCIRSRLANLKNPKNPHLRQDLLTGILAPEVFAHMSIEEMAGEELRRLREGYTRAAIGEHQLPQRLEGTSTTKVRCRRCQGMDCRVTQIPRGTLFLPSWVRSGNADEEAMTFMTCASCGEQWYHSRWVCL